MRKIILLIGIILISITVLAGCERINESYCKIECTTEAEAREYYRQNQTPIWRFETNPTINKVNIFFNENMELMLRFELRGQIRTNNKIHEISKGKLINPIIELPFNLSISQMRITLKNHIINSRQSFMNSFQPIKKDELCIPDERFTGCYYNTQTGNWVCP